LKPGQNVGITLQQAAKSSCYRYAVICFYGMNGLKKPAGFGDVRRVEAVFGGIHHQKADLTALGMKRSAKVKGGDWFSFPQRVWKFLG
jgi:hypothetical protein